jgi:hypothetical protein
MRQTPRNARTVTRLHGSSQGSARVSACLRERLVTTRTYTVVVADVPKPEGPGGRHGLTLERGEDAGWRAVFHPDSLAHDRYRTMPVEAVRRYRGPMPLEAVAEAARSGRRWKADLAPREDAPARRPPAGARHPALGSPGDPSGPACADGARDAQARQVLGKSVEDVFKAGDERAGSPKDRPTDGAVYLPEINTYVIDPNMNTGAGSAGGSPPAAIR